MNAGKRRHYRTLRTTSIIWIAAVAFLYLSAGYLNELLHWPYRWLDLRTQDRIARIARAAPADPRLFLLVDDAPSHNLDQLWDDEIEASPALRLMKRRTWSREVFAHVLERLASAGARVVAFDYMFQGEDDGDPALAVALEKWKHVAVVGAHFEEARMAKNFVPPPKTLIPTSDAPDPRVGYVNHWPEVDGVIRRVWLRITREEVGRQKAGSSAAVYEAIGTRMVRQAGLHELIPEDRLPRWFRYAFRSTSLERNQKPHSLYEVFVPAIWERNYQNGEFFRDKLVLVGPEGRYHKDLGRSPFGTLAGPEFHLNTANALLQKQFLEDTPLWVDFLLIVISGVLAWASGRFVSAPVPRFLLVVLLGCAWFGAAVFFYNADTVVPVFSPLFVLLGSTVSFSVAEQILDRRERARMRKTFERYVSRDVVKELLDNPESYLNTLGGTRKQVAVLFSDVRGFTTLTESSDAQALVTQLNEYFTEMVRIVFAHRGTLDKFIGDAVMAHWGSIVSEGETNDARNAVATALEMRRTLLRLNPPWKERGMLELNFGIGVNQGEVIAGNLGASGDYEKMEITVIGDAVNLASRLEGVTKTYHIDLCIGENVAAFVRNDFILRSLDLIVVKGKTKPVEIFAVLDERSPATTEPPWLANHEAAMQHYRHGAFAEAERCWREVLAQNPGDSISEIFLERCVELQTQAPIQDWKGVFEMTSK